MLAADACPFCGGPIAGDEVKWVQGGRILSRGGLSVQLSKNQAAIFEFLWNRRNTANYYTVQQLADHVYRDDPDGGPDWVASCIHVMIFRIRVRTAGFGFTLPASRGRGAGYRISTVEAH